MFVLTVHSNFMLKAVQFMIQQKEEELSLPGLKRHTGQLLLSYDKPCGKLALGQNSRFARCHHLTTTTRILFVVSLLFKVMLKPQWGLNNNCPN